MPGTSSYLFVYGTLLDERNPFALYLKNGCAFYKKGKFRGKLFDLGEYPGAIMLPGEGFVYGNIFLMDSPEETLKKLDEYEGFDSARIQPNEFIREFAEIECDTGPVNCWLYLYNQPVEGHWHIGSGNYLEYIGVQSAI
jgi:gamma-glutamylcyclotransferase (GGCT)/AIG2-like uncharacterized protein YtfP